MSNIRFKKKPRKDPGGAHFTMKGSDQIFVGRDYERQVAIDLALEKTRARGCFKGCRTCGACSNSQRDASHPFSYDNEQGKLIDCRKCEPYRFHDCHNGVMRDTRQEAEPFTDSVIEMLEKSGGKPLI